MLVNRETYTDGNVTIETYDDGIPAINIVTSYRDEKAGVFVYKNVPMKLTDGARADLTALYFTALLNQSIPNETVLAEWQERGYEAIHLTAGDLRADGDKFMQHRQKCFTAASVVKASINDYTTAEEIKTAFDEAYNNA